MIHGLISPPQVNIAELQRQLAAAIPTHLHYYIPLVQWNGYIKKLAQLIVDEKPNGDQIDG